MGGAALWAREGGRRLLPAPRSSRRPLPRVQVYERAGAKASSGRGWCRFGLRVDPATASSQRVFEEYHVGYHGAASAPSWAQHTRHSRERTAPRRRCFHFHGRGVLRSSRGGGGSHPPAAPQAALAFRRRHPAGRGGLDRGALAPHAARQHHAQGRAHPAARGAYRGLGTSCGQPAPAAGQRLV